MGRMQPKILLAERNPNIRRFMHTQFMQRGLGAVMAATGYDVQEIVQRAPSLQVIILDPALPHFSVLLAENGSSFVFTIPVIFFAHEDELDPSLQALATACVFKKADPDALLAVVEDVLRLFRNNNEEGSLWQP